ncbi:MAG: dipeptidyl-peptidase-4, partial [Colwellia sp.]
MPKIKITRWLSTTVLTTAIAVSLMACQSTSTENTTETKMNVEKSSSLTVERIYKDREFSSDYISRLRWLADGSGYTIVEKSEKTTTNEEGKEVSIGRDIVVYNPETLERTVLISAQQLTPLGTDKPLTIDDYTWSDDRQKLLIYTNSKKVWRSNSRGDYWLLDMKAKKLMQLGGKKPVESSLMFAKFSPDASKVAYVVADNIYVENLTNN